MDNEKQINKIGIIILYKNYRKFSPWHYVNFPFDSSYEVHPKNDKGDLIIGINTCIEVLKNSDSSKRG